MRLSDADIEHMLKLLTPVPLEKIAEIVEEHMKAPEKHVANFQQMKRFKTNRTLVGARDSVFWDLKLPNSFMAKRVLHWHNQQRMFSLEEILTPL
jgi:hypothetical protein